MAREYRSALALEQAVKAAAKKSGQDVGRAVEGFYVGRLLERVFSEERKPFVLKGGRAILARTIDARYTTDTDFLYRGDNLEAALEELKHLASKDLGDRIEFRFVSADRIAATQEYRDGCRVRFDVILDGTRHKSEISIDLVADPVELRKADLVTPANRLDVKGLVVFDYLVYPVERTVADKVCATMQTYSGGRESSRVKDLVDLVLHVTRYGMAGSDLSRAIEREAGMRGVGPLDTFRVPESWYGHYSRAYRKAAAEAKIPDRWFRVADAEEIVRACVDPAIRRQVEGFEWNPEALEWTPRNEMSRVAQGSTGRPENQNGEVLCE